MCRRDRCWTVVPRWASPWWGLLVDVRLGEAEKRSKRIERGETVGGSLEDECEGSRGGFGFDWTQRWRRRVVRNLAEGQEMLCDRY